MVKIRVVVLVGIVVCINFLSGMDEKKIVVPEEFYRARAEEYIKEVGKNCDGIKIFLEERITRARARLEGGETKEDKRELRFLVDGQFLAMAVPISTLSLPTAIFSRMVFENFSYRLRMELGCHCPGEVLGDFEKAFSSSVEVPVDELKEKIEVAYGNKDKSCHNKIFLESKLFSEAVLAQLD